MKFCWSTNISPAQSLWISRCERKVLDKVTPKTWLRGHSNYLHQLFFFLFYTHIPALHMSLAFWAWRRQGRQKRHLAGEKKTGFSDINPINELVRTCQWDAERAEHWTDKSACFQREFLLMSEGMGERRVTSAAIPSFTSRRHPYW